MLNKYTLIVINLLLFASFFQAMAQQDTIYVYEDVIVYDTIIVYDTVFVKPEIDSIDPIKLKTISILQLNTVKLNANLLLISNNKTATIPINHIILNEKFSKNIKNLKSMKKLSFFGVVLFAFQTMVLAQTNYQVSLGTGMWWQRGKTQHVEKPYSCLFDIGIFAKRNFTNTHMGLKTGLEYAYLLSTGKYKFDGTTGVWHSKDGTEFEDINNNYGSGLHYFSLPLLVYFDKYKIQPYMGVNYNSITTGMQTNQNGKKHFNQTHNFGVNAGLGFVLSQKISINLEFKHNLTPDYKENISQEGSVDGTNVLGSSYNLRNAQTKISLIYTFKKKEE